jgi:UDP-N-acetylglucosamine 2-epimerase (non-hydrolysing)
VLGLGKDIQWKMSDWFFDDLNIPEPDVNHSRNGGTQAEQTAAIMVSFEKDLMADSSDLLWLQAMEGIIKHFNILIS